MATMFHLLALAALILPTISSPPSQAPLLSSDTGPRIEYAQANAAHVFNAIHSAGRQWGSSLKHNGMTFFVAGIPNNTLLYHGTHIEEAVTGIEWLAFEIEHAEVFARSRGPGGPGRRPGGPGSPDRPGKPGDPEHGPPPRQTVEDRALKDKEMDDEPPSHGFLHIYKTKKALTRLLYIDGMSAGKTTMGTLDTQDLVLREGEAEVTTQSAAPFDEGTRARQLCALGEEVGFDGIVRLEAGFELILCNFTDGVELVEAIQRPDYNAIESFSDRAQFEYMRGVSLRYQGIPAHRLEVDFSALVSAFFYPTNLTNPKQPEQPRLVSSDRSVLDRIKSDVKELFLTYDEPHKNADWQGVVDMIVTRYSERLQVMAANHSTNNTLLSEINFLLNVFINYKDPDTETAIKKCISHYLTEGFPHHLVHASVSTVTEKICRSLFTARKILVEGKAGEKAATDQARSEVKDLMAYLDWTTWHECGRCGLDEVCVIAVWPWGSVEDHYNPGCQKRDQNSDSPRYWSGGPGGGPGGGRPGGGRS